MKKFIPILFALLACQKQPQNIDKAPPPEFCSVVSDYTGPAPQRRMLAGDPCILLKFNGYSLPAGTCWNNGAAKQLPPSGLSEDSILKIITKIRDDFAPINLIIDTVQQYYDDAPADRRTIIVFTPDTTITNAFGFAVANQSAFFLGTLCRTPGAVVFPNRADFGTTDEFAFAASHEIGHTMGEHHSVYCDPGGGMAPIGPFGYFQNSPVSYLPILNGYYINAKITNWVIAPDDHSCPAGTGNVNQLQKFADLCGWRVDEAGSDLNTATSFSFGQFNFKTGVLGQGDVDVWKYVRGDKIYNPVNITIKVESMYGSTSLLNYLAQPEPLYANIDLMAEVYNDVGVLQGIYDVFNNANLTNIPMSANWYIKIKGSDDNQYMNPINMTGRYVIRKQ